MRRRRTFNYQAGVITGYDAFTGTAAGGVLSARTAPLGGAWATSGTTGDFTFTDNHFSTGSEEIQRVGTADTGPRYAILGTATPTDTEVGVLISAPGNPAAAVASWSAFVIARWTDANNHLRLRLLDDNATIEQVVAGVVTTLAGNSGALVTPTAIKTGQLRLIAYASGHVIATCLDANGGVLNQLQAMSSVVATGGALASGKAGIADQCVANTGFTRWYDSFYLSTPSAEPIALYPGRTLEIRSDDAIRQDSTGTYYGRVPSYRGSRLFVPPAGDKNRISRIMVKADRNDLETAADTPLGDTLQVQAFVTPRYLAVPG